MLTANIPQIYGDMYVNSVNVTYFGMVIQENIGSVSVKPNFLFSLQQKSNTYKNETMERSK